VTVLQKFLARDKLFYTKEFRDTRMLEARARYNLAAEIERIVASSNDFNRPLSNPNFSSQRLEPQTAAYHPIVLPRPHSFSFSNGSH
jgi:hypothetical protein